MWGCEFIPCYYPRTEYSTCGSIWDLTQHNGCTPDCVKTLQLNVCDLNVHHYQKDVSTLAKSTIPGKWYKQDVCEHHNASVWSRS